MPNEIESKLKGKTLQVYLYMLKHDKVGVREVQRDLEFSSPSVASYHLEKLIEMGLVAKDEYGQYYVSKKADLTMLESYINILGYTVPRLIFFAICFTTLLITYIITNYEAINIHALVFAIIASTIFWFESIRLWLKRPF
ncbi:MAG: helix-turn-helix domain-containing protein [Candidatus Nitrosocaldaceae archaeon]